MFYHFMPNGVQLKGKGFAKIFWKTGSGISTEYM